MNIKKTVFTLFSVLILVISIAFGIFQYRQKQNFELIHPKRGDIFESIYGLGAVTSTRVYEHRLGVISAIRRLHVQLGDVVKKGDRLIDFDETRSLTAPFAGTITSLPFHEGENVFPQVPLIRIEDLSSRVVEVGLEQLGALRIRPNQKARLSFENMRGEYFAGIVNTLYPVSGQFVVRIEPENLPLEILPGMTSDVAIEVGEKKNVLLIPASAVVSGKVTLIKDGHRKKIDIKVGGSDSEWVEVLSNNLKEEDTLQVPKK